MTLVARAVWKVIFSIKDADNNENLMGSSSKMNKAELKARTSEYFKLFPYVAK